MIVSFRDADAEKFYNGETVKKFANIQKPLMRKLRTLALAESLEDCRFPPGNRLEALKGNRAGQYSIRVNDQFRICFNWTKEGPENVEVVDYH